MLLLNIPVVPLILLILTEMAIGQKFEKAVTPNGTLICSTDTPSSVVNLDSLPKDSSCMSPGAQCSLQCKQLPKCISFNYKKQTRTCELFNFNPQICSFEYGCTFYHIQGQQSCPGSGLQMTTMQTTKAKQPTTTLFLAPTTSQSLTQATVGPQPQTTSVSAPQATTESGIQTSTESGTQATNGLDEQATSESGAQSTTGSGTQATTGSGTQATTGSGTQATNGLDEQATSESGAQATNGSATQATNGLDAQATSESGAQATNGSGTQATSESEAQATTGTQVTEALNLQSTVFSAALDTSMPPNSSVSSTAATASIVCSSNVSTSEMYLGQYVNLTCTFNNVGMESPVMTWTDNNGMNVSNATTVTSGNRVISSILIRGDFPTVGSFECNAQLPSSSSYYSCSTPTITVVCPSGFDYLPGAESCYKFINNSVDWNGALQACQQTRDGAYSVMITSVIEQLAITPYLKENFNQTASSACKGSSSSLKMVWTCGQVKNTALCQPEQWKPSLNVAFPFNYTNWASGAPRCSTPSSVEPNVAIFDNADCSWDDRKQTDVACVFCEYGPY